METQDSNLTTYLIPCDYLKRAVYVFYLPPKGYELICILITLTDLIRVKYICFKLINTLCNMKNLLTLVCVALLMTSCDIKQKKETKLPDLDIDVEAGQLPTFDVDWADVNVGTKTETIAVPKVVIVMEEEEVEVPYIDVDMPNAGEKEERTLSVQAEVEGKAHNIEIVQIWATGKKLYVISELKMTDQDIGDQKMRVSDQVTLNAPDLDVAYYIIGKRPNRLFNKQYKYLDATSDLKNKLTNPKVIYSK